MCEVPCLSEMVFFFISSSFTVMDYVCLVTVSNKVGVTYSNKEMHKDLLVRFLLDSKA